MRYFVNFAIIGIILVSAAVSFAAEPEFVLPAELALALPVNGSVKAEWLSPPLPVDKVQRGGFMDQRYRLDRQATPWMLHNQRYITNLNTGAVFSVARLVSDFIWMNDGALFLASEKSLGMLATAKEVAGGPKDVPVALFQPVIDLPTKHCQLATDGKGAILAYGYDPSEKGSVLFELNKGFAGWRKLFASADRISDVCVAEGSIHIASGRTIYTILPGSKGATVAFTHPLDNITSLSCRDGSGLFFATPRGVGAVNGAGIEFIKSNWTKIEVRDDALYLFMTESLGVLRLNNISKLLEKSK